MYPKGYRGFESLSLRHAVCTAEKTARNSCEIARIGRNCANLSRKADRRKCPAQSCRQAFAPFSLGGIRAVRFQGLHQANALRSQTDDVAGRVAVSSSGMGPSGTTNTLSVSRAGHDGQSSSPALCNPGPRSKSHRTVFEQLRRIVGRIKASACKQQLMNELRP